MPALSTGPPAVGSPRMPLPSPPPPAAATGVVVFSQPARAAPTPAVRASAPPRRSRDRRDTPRGGSSGFEGSFKAERRLSDSAGRCQGGPPRSDHRARRRGLNVHSAPDRRDGMAQAGAGALPAQGAQRAGGRGVGGGGGHAAPPGRPPPPEGEGMHPPGGSRPPRGRGPER